MILQLSLAICNDPIITAVRNKTFMFGDADIKDAIALHRKANAVSRTINIRAFTHSDDCGAEAVLFEDCIRFFEIAF